jgi:hypothetical protein
MGNDVFQEAYDRVRERFTTEAWLTLDPRQITQIIYAEMRRIDAERQSASTPSVDCASGNGSPA